MFLVGVFCWVDFMHSTYPLIVDFRHFWGKAEILSFSNLNQPLNSEANKVGATEGSPWDPSSCTDAGVAW